jgi:ectoine hydroxylase-related dioxygenase (phytanoyl-CoA dioxygenase family)
MSVKLSQQELKTYQESGWLVPDYTLPMGLLDEMRCEYDVLLENNRHLESNIMLAPHQTNGGSQGVVGSEKWLEFATHPALMEIAGQLIGDDIILWGTTIFGKPAHNGKKTPWHQDGDYYPIRPLETLTLWIPLDDVTPDNGAMRFIPGSHQAHELFSHSRREGGDMTINLVCDEKHFDESTAEDLILKAGQVSFHDVYMIHGSKANRTDKRRAAFVVRMMPASSYYDHALGAKMGTQHAAHGYGTRPLHLVRGKDVCGKNNFSIGH